MKRKQFLKTGTVVLIFYLMALLPVYAVDDVVIKGKLNNSGKGILDGDSKQYTIIPSENMEYFENYILGLTQKFSERGRFAKVSLFDDNNIPFCIFNASVHRRDAG